MSILKPISKGNNDQVHVIKKKLFHLQQKETIFGINMLQ